jgi:hypothetical protein
VYVFATLTILLFYHLTLNCHTAIMSRPLVTDRLMECDAMRRDTMRRGAICNARAASQRKSAT